MQDEFSSNDDLDRMISDNEVAGEAKLGEGKHIEVEQIEDEDEEHNRE